MKFTVNAECYLCRNEFNTKTDEYKIRYIKKPLRKPNKKALICKTCYELNEEVLNTKDLINIENLDLDIIK